MVELRLLEAFKHARSDQIRRWRRVGICEPALPGRAWARHGADSRRRLRQRSRRKLPRRHAKKHPTQRARGQQAHHELTHRLAPQTYARRRRAKAPTARRAPSRLRRSAASRRLTRPAPGKFRKRSSASTTCKASQRARGTALLRPRCSAIRQIRDGNRRQLQIPER